jgi:peptidoglycan hydrolase CwlO-like protein
MSTPIPEIPEGAYGVLAALVTQAVLTVWHAATAWTRIKASEERAREHTARLDRLEARMEDHDDKLDKLFGEVRERLARIEATLSIISGMAPGRRLHDGN